MAGPVTQSAHDAAATLRVARAKLDSAALLPRHSLEQDIEATRDELDRTLDELQAKLSPRRQLRDALRATRQNGADLARIALDYSRRHPLRIAVAGALLLTVAGRRLLTHRAP